MKEELGKALKRLREMHGYTQQQVADRLGIAKGNVSRYESGAQAPEFERLVQIATLYGKNPSELFAFAERGGNVIEGPEVSGSVPLISWVQAGHWREVYQAEVLDDAERIATTYRPRTYTYALRVRGDSMEPKFPQGAILIVEPEETPENGAYVIVRQNGGEATFKQLMVDGDVKLLKPINPRYPIMQMNDDAEFCGVVKRVEMDV